MSTGALRQSLSMLQYCSQGHERSICERLMMLMLGTCIDTCTRIKMHDLTMQVWGSFRHESYTRHKVIGRIVMACMLGAYVPAAQIAYHHLTGETWPETVGQSRLQQISAAKPTSHCSVNTASSVPDPFFCAMAAN